MFNWTNLSAGRPVSDWPHWRKIKFAIVKTCDKGNSEIEEFHLQTENADFSHSRSCGEKDCLHNKAVGQFISEKCFHWFRIKGSTSWSGHKRQDGPIIEAFRDEDAAKKGVRGNDLIVLGGGDIAIDNDKKIISVHSPCRHFGPCPKEIILEGLLLTFPPENGWTISVSDDFPGGE